jgi:hypothetical protein
MPYEIHAETVFTMQITADQARLLSTAICFMRLPTEHTMSDGEKHRLNDMRTQLRQLHKHATGLQ